MIGFGYNREFIFPPGKLVQIGMVYPAFDPARIAVKAKQRFNDLVGISQCDVEMAFVMSSKETRNYRRQQVTAGRETGEDANARGSRPWHTFNVANPVQYLNCSWQEFPPCCILHDSAAMPVEQPPFQQVLKFH